MVSLFNGKSTLFRLFNAKAILLEERVLLLCEMQSVSSRIWTSVVGSISYDDNHYTTGINVLLYDNIQQKSHREKMHWAYSADFAPCVIYLFHSLQNVLNDKRFSQKDQVRTFVENFLSSKPTEFYLSKIYELPDKRQKVI